MTSTKILFAFVRFIQDYKKKKMISFIDCKFTWKITILCKCCQLSHDTGLNRLIQTQTEYIDDVNTRTTDVQSIIFVAKEWKCMIQEEINNTIKNTNFC